MSARALQQKTKLHNNDTNNSNYCLSSLVPRPISVFSSKRPGNGATAYGDPMPLISNTVHPDWPYGNAEPTSHKITQNNWGERERAPQRTRCHDREDRRAYVHRYCACAALRANVAGRIGKRFSPAESAFSACIGSGSSQSS